MKKILLTTIIFLQLTTIALAQPGTICWRKMSAGKDFNLAIKFDGTLWGWGANVNQLGLGFAGNQNLPIQIGTANDWVEISAGFNHSLAIKLNGTLWSWGDGLNGGLGNGAFASVSLVPTQVGTAANWTAISAGTGFSLALTNTNELYSWGKNNVGQLGNGTLTNTNTPTQVGTATDWLKVDVGHEHSLAIRSTLVAPLFIPTLWSFGNNTTGQLGNNTLTLSNVPVQLLPAISRTWSEISAGFDHSLAIDTMNNLFAWGNNNNGQLGDGTFVSQNVPILTAVPSTGLSVWTRISAGFQFTMALDNTSNLLTWGNNVQGALGLGNLTTINIPGSVASSTTWIDISAGEFHGLGHNGSGLTIFSSGRNNEGQLGVGSFTDSNTYNAVACGSSLATQNNVAVANEISVYPNPASTVLNIKSSNPILNISISDINGRLIQETYQTEINIEQFSKGIYLMKITTEIGVSTQKIIKE
jgi:alpha-tubulin suppressor-like RCC1 family protein